MCFFEEPKSAGCSAWASSGAWNTLIPSVNRFGKTAHKVAALANAFLRGFVGNARQRLHHLQNGLEAAIFAYQRIQPIPISIPREESGLNSRISRQQKRSPW
jgi:hypothetical protein